MSRYERHIIRNTEELLIAIAEVCEDEDGSIRDIGISEIESSFTCKDSELYPMAYRVDTELYERFLYMIDLFDRISSGHNFKFTARDITGYIVGYLASIYMPERSREDLLTLRSDVYRVVLENNSGFRFLQDELLYEVGDANDIYIQRQRKVDNFVKKYLWG